MTKEELDNLKSLINLKIKELSNKFFDKDVDTDGDETDEAQGTYILDMAYEYNDRRNIALNSLDEALSKIKNGEYGNCEECDNLIDYKRLLICPDAKYCIRCAELIEKENRIYRSTRV